MSIVAIWYIEHGHHPADLTNRRTESPWYLTKTEPSFEDMLVKLRRVLIAARLSPARPAQPTPEEQSHPRTTPPLATVHDDMKEAPIWREMLGQSPAGN
jgi:hypothetical protein